jgi:hypothetical protein
MFRKRRRENILRENEARQTQERFERNERAGKEIYARMAELKNVPRENLPDAVFMISMAAKHQSEQIRQSIKDRTRYDFDFDTLTDGDLATYLAANPQNRKGLTETSGFPFVASSTLNSTSFCAVVSPTVTYNSAMQVTACVALFRDLTSIVSSNL